MRLFLWLSADCLFEFQAAPEIPAGHTSVRMPAFADFLHLHGCWQFTFPVCALNGGTHSQVSRSQDVGPPQSENQEHMRGPFANALDICERGYYFFIRHPVQIGKVNFSREGMLGKIANVADLLPGETRATHLSDTQGLNCFRGNRSSGGFLKTTINRARRLAAQLLKHNGARQRFKTRFAVSDFVGSNAGNDGSNYRIALLQM